MKALTIANPTIKTHHLLAHTDKTCFIIKQLFSPAFCQQIKHRAIDKGFCDANDKYPNSYRNNQRLVEDNPLLAQSLYNVCKSYIPNRLMINAQHLSAHSLNERLRYCKYSNNQEFTIHRDGVFYREHKQQSALTFLLYLNNHDEFTGGETHFYSDQQGKNLLASYTPEIGDVAIFDHRIWHSGNKVTRGDKYILRSDFIYLNNNIQQPSGFHHSSFDEKHHNGYIWKIMNIGDNLFASASRDKSIKIWDKELKCKQVLKKHQHSVFDIAIDSQKNIYAVSRDGYMTIWKRDKQQYQLKSRLNTHHPCVLQVLTLNNNTLATSGSDGMIRLWKNQQQIAQLKHHKGWVWGLINSKKENVISCDANGKVIIWDSQTHNIIATTQYPTCTFRCMAIYEDTLFLGDEQGNITALDATTLKHKRQWQAHEGIVRDILTTKESIISCGEDNNVYLAKHDGTHKEVLFTHSNFATSLCLSSHNVIISASYSGKLKAITCTQKR